MPSVDALAALVGGGGLHTTDSLASAGYDRPALFRAVRAGVVARIAPGIFASVDVAAEPESELAALALLNPEAVVCLLSAAQMHDVTDELPGRVWMAVGHDRKNGLRLAGCLPGHPVWWRPELLTHGIEVRVAAGVPIRVTDLPRTVVDMIRYRGKLGDEPAMKALHDFMRLGRDPGELWAAAKAIGALASVEPFVRAADEFRESIPTRGP